MVWFYDEMLDEFNNAFNLFNGTVVGCNISCYDMSCVQVD